MNSDRIQSKQSGEEDKPIEEIILYIKAALLTGAVGLISLMTMLCKGVEDLSALSGMTVIFLFTYLMILAEIEEGRKIKHGKAIYKKKPRRKNL